MSKFTIANLKKTIHYLKRNGLRDTYLAALERLGQKEDDTYAYEPPSEERLAEQRVWSRTHKAVKFSILVPAYRTPVAYLEALLDSVVAQTYPNWELILAEAGTDMTAPGGESPISAAAQAVGDSRIRYVALGRNGGIAENTNAALKEATGDYIGLLDHDDLLTPDALFEMAAEIERAREQGIVPGFLYSDEDKCEESGTAFYDLHRKCDFNLDLLLSNNYICHFTVMEAGLMRRLGFRQVYDGAQDHDLVLRAAGELLLGEQGRLQTEGESRIRHIAKVLYHWRCHKNSTAENPESKQYAYEAGCRAVTDFFVLHHVPCRVEPAANLGFFKVIYMPDVMAARADVGIVGGKLLDGKRRVTGALYTLDGTADYKGLPAGFGGRMHRASLQQDMDTVDIRLMRIRPELLPLLAEVLSGQEEWADHVREEQGRLRVEGLSEEACERLSRELCHKVRAAGYRILWQPEWREKVK